MKKIVFVIPLMAISFLTNCGSNPKKPIDLLIRVDTYLDENKYQTTLYTYNKSYNITKIEEIEYEYQSEEIHSDAIYTFTYRGNKILYIDHSWVVEGKEIATSRVTLTYDSKSNLIQTEEIGTEYGEVFKYKSNYKYNEQKLKISYEQYHATSGDYELTEKHTYKYNDHKDISEDVEIDYTSDGSGTTTYTYDEYYCCIHQETDYVSREDTYINTTYHKNNPDKPLHKYASYRGVNTDYTYDELDRLKTKYSVDVYEESTREDYYYDD